MCDSIKQPTVTSQLKNTWLNIYINHVLHLSLYTPSLVKIQTWANTAPKWRFWDKSKRYYIETTHKHGVQDISDYADRQLWNDVAGEINKHMSINQD